MGSCKRLPRLLAKIGDALLEFRADNRNLAFKGFHALIQRLDQIDSGIVKLILLLAERRHIPV